MSHETDEPVYTVLDPRSREPEVEFRGINPRPDTLNGKKVIVANVSHGNRVCGQKITGYINWAEGVSPDILQEAITGRTVRKIIRWMIDPAPND